jgi:hypothetical protein
MFSEARFQREFSSCVDQAWATWQRDPRAVEAGLTEVTAEAAPFGALTT